MKVPPPSEVALAVVVTLVMAVDLQQSFNWVLGLVLVVLAGATLLLRDRVPELPLGAICAVNVLLATTAPGRFAPQTVVLGVIVALYSAAVRLAGRRAVVAGALSLLAVWVAHVGSREGDVADFWPFLIWGAPWLAGRLARRQALHAQEAGARAAVLLAEQEQQTREAAGRERDRIARELHDVVAHSVSLMVVQAGAARVAHPSAPTAAALDAIETTGRQALVELRTMLGVLREGGDEARGPQPDLSSLPDLVEQVRSAGLPVELRTTGAAAVPAGVALSAYRIVQEALTNALRHAGPVPTEVVVDVGDELLIEVRSRLSTQSVSGTGRGVVGMRERVALHDGSLEAGPEGADWVVRARMPV